VLRITAVSTSKVVLKLEGRLIGPWVEELRKTVSRADLRGGLEIDISDLTFADHDGEKALQWLHKLGARFYGKESISTYLFARLKIPLHSQPMGFDGNGKPGSG